MPFASVVSTDSIELVVSFTMKIVAPETPEPLSVTVPDIGVFATGETAEDSTLAKEATPV